MCGENKGTLRVKTIHEKDRNNQVKATRQLKDAGFNDLVDHRSYFRDADDNTVCTFSPYTAKRLPENVPEWLRMSEYSIYVMSTKTFVVVVANEHTRKII